MSALRPARLIAGAAVVAAAGCTGTNITAPPVVGGGIFFASDRADANFELYRVSAEGGSARRLTTDVEHNDLAPALSIDGANIAWEREVASSSGLSAVEIWVMDADGSNAHAVVANGSENRSPSWTPGGDALVFASFVTGNWEIHRVDLTTGATVNLTESPFADQAPRVSPDGETIVFHSNRDVQFEIYAMDADGSRPRNLTRDGADDRHPSWTPDGTTVVWSRFIDTFDVWSMAADGSGQRVVTTSEYQETDPSVSPDGRAVVYQTNRLPAQGLEIVPLSGGTPRAITTGRGAGSDLHPFWAPAP